MFSGPNWSFLRLRLHEMSLPLDQVKICFVQQMETCFVLYGQISQNGNVVHPIWVHFTKCKCILPCTGTFHKIDTHLWILHAVIIDHMWVSFKSVIHMYPLYPSLVMSNSGTWHPLCPTQSLCQDLHSLAFLLYHCTSTSYPFATLLSYNLARHLDPFPFFSTFCFQYWYRSCFHSPTLYNF